MKKAVVCAAAVAAVIAASSCSDGANPGAEGDADAVGGAACKVSADCPSGQYCDTAASVCVSGGGGGDDGGGGGQKVCTPGATGCVGDDLTVCNAGGTKWDRQFCPAGKVCRDGACTAPTCTPGERKCTDDGKLQSCDPATSTWSVTECGDRKICINNRCVGVICAAGEKRCAGDGTVQTCNEKGTGFTSEACPQGEVCDIDQCRQMVCTAGETKCTDAASILNTCNSRGTAWDQVQCGVGTTCDLMDIDGGSVYLCLSQTCVPGEKRCKPGDGAVQECNAGGTAWTDTPCDAGFVCENTACVAQICTAGEVKCCTDADAPLCTAADAATTTVCNAKGTARDLKGCGAATVCIADKCVPKICSAGFTKCDGAKVMECNADGTAFDEKDVCSDPGGIGNHCVHGRCMDACAEAELTKAYIGCEYWPTVTMNSQLDAQFQFAVAVSNTYTSPASITITRGGSTVATDTVAVGQVKTIVLPWVTELKDTISAEASRKVVGGAYNLRSTVPVTVYQFSPLQFEIGGVNSYSNDASLLLPTHVLSTNYYALAYQSLVLGTKFITISFRGGSPSIFSVVGTQDNTTVSVKFSCNTLPGTGGVGTYTPNQTVQFQLNRGDVLQMGSAVPQTCSAWEKDPSLGSTDYYCNVGKNYDVTGSNITADKPVAVFSGHNCAFVPYNKWACDHMEEQMFPVETWGNHYVMTRPVPKQNPAEPTYYRVISGFAGNKVSFVPAAVHADVTLDKGGWVEFSTTQDFEINGTLGFAVGQMMTGEDYNGAGSSTSGVGDPSLSLGVPVEQYRTDYNFLTPSTYTESYVNITAPAGAPVTLDGQPASGFTAVGSGAYQVAKIKIQPGQHTINSSQLVGIAVYGYASYTSYMYPGGLNLLPLNE